jgi:ferrous iron transport protein B
VVAALGVIFSEGGQFDPQPDQGLQSALRGAVWEGTDRPLFDTGVALSMMVFFALCAQCVATLAIIRRETNSWRWPAFTFAYMTLLAYLGALASYQLTHWVGLG